MDVALRHLKLDAAADGSPSAQDADVALKLAQAQAVVLDYVDGHEKVEGSPPIWTEETLPPSIQAGILEQLADLWRFRGDDETESSVEDGYLSPRVKNLLHRWRTPVIS